MRVILLHIYTYTITHSLIQPLPLLFIHYLPGGPEEQRAMQADKRSNKWGGMIFLAVMFSSLLLTVVEAIIKIA